ncbi:MAG TPA: phosphate-starvation-inducible PsiE family protein, partial [Xanthomonadales bacterium]|nr:phosphate-starvation-inducible PsiE family protein [Xanthomonadales bacterium]
AASLATVMLVVMAQGLWTLARLAIVEGREPRVVLPQIVLLFIFVELFRTLLFYLREHRVSVGLMIEVAIVSILRELLINPPDASIVADAGVAALLLVLGALMVADRMTIARTADQPAPAGPAELT